MIFLLCRYSRPLMIWAEKYFTTSREKVLCFERNSAIEPWEHNSIRR